MSSTTLKIGDKAPDFDIQIDGKPSGKLSQLWEKNNLVVYFYPKDDTPGCTAQACEFRDAYEDFKDLGAEIVGISSDSGASHEKFKSKHRLPFILLSDEDGSMRKAFGVPSTFFILPGRVTYIIDKQGIVRHIFSSQFQSTKHIEVAKNILKEWK